MQATRIPRRFAAVVCVAMLAVACLASSASTASAASKKKVTIVVSTPIGVLLPPFYAEAQGFFDRAGIDAKVQFAFPPQNLALLVSNRAQVAIGGAPQMDLGAAKAPIKIAGMWANHLDSQFIVGPGIKSRKDLKGKVVGVAGIGTQSWVLVQKWLQDAGMSLNDVKVTSAPSLAVAITAFVNGQIDGIFSSPPATATMLQRPGSSILHQFGGGIEWTTGEIVVNSDWAKKNRSTAVAVMGALDAAVKSWLNNPNKAKAIIRQQAGITDPNQLDAAYTSTKKIFLNGVRPVTPTFERKLLTLLKDTGVTAPSPSTAAKLVDTSYAAAIQPKKK